MKNTNAATSVMKKLSALRITLSTEEQQVLDSIVISVTEDDVQAHAWHDKNISSVVSSAANTAVEDKKISLNAEEDEVVAHSVHDKNISSAVNTAVKDKSISLATDDDEVMAHAMQGRSSGAVAGAVEGASSGKLVTTMKVAFDAEKKVYVVVTD
jgi:hypothetical protein